MERFEIHLVEHCNLKCQCCDHYSPLAKEEYANEESFENDMKRMGELFPYVHLIRLLGGEPLLHPNINFFIKTTRKYFPIAEIRITTNAILLDKMSEEFWTCCNNNNITIEYTYYPINLDRQKHKELAYKYGVNLIPFNYDYREIKTSYRMPIKETKTNDPRINFYNCPAANSCIMLRDKNLYTCTRIPNIQHFNRFFNKKIPVTKNDYINIYEHTAEEIEKFLATPPPFCSYCNIAKNTQNQYGQIPWNQTKYDINEWLDE